MVFCNFHSPSHYNLISQHLKLQKGQPYWPFQDIYHNYVKQLLLGFWQKKKKKIKPWIKWLAKKEVFPKNKQHSKKRSSYKKLLATMALSITWRICQNRQIQLRQANIWGGMCVCAFGGFFFFKKQAHCNRRHQLPNLVHSCAFKKVSHLPQKSQCPNTVGGKASPMALCAPQSPITQSNWRQEDQGNLLCRSQSYKRTCPQQNMQEIWKPYTRSTRAAVSCCGLQQGITG